MQATDPRIQDMIVQAVQTVLQATGVNADAPDGTAPAVRAVPEPQPSTSTGGFTQTSVHITSRNGKRRCLNNTTDKDSDATVQIPLQRKKKPSVPSRRMSDIDKVSAPYFSGNDSDEEADSLAEISEINDEHNKVLANDANRQADPVDQLIEREYAEEENKSFLPSIPSKLATAVTHWCHNVPDREQIKKAFKNTLILDNVEGLLPVRINEILYQHMSFRSKMNDQHLRWINSFVTWGLGPITAVLDQVLKMEANLAMSECTVEIDGGCLLIGKDQFDIHHLRQLLDQSVYILAICNSVGLQKRKSQLRECLDKNTIT